MTTFNNTKVYVAACLGMMFFGVAFIVMGAVLPAMTEKYALNEAQSSLLVAFLPFGILTGSLLFGPVADRFGYKSLLCFSTLFVASGLWGLSYFDNFNALRASIFVIGLGGGVLNGETNAIVADIYTGKEGASRLSLLGMFYGLGALGVPLLVGFFSEYTYEIILRWTGVVILLSVAYFITVKFPMPKYKQGFPVKDAIKLVKEPALILISFILFFQSGLEGLINNWSTTFLTDAKVEQEKALLALTALIVGMTLTRFILTYLLLKIKTLHILTAGLLLLATGIGILNYATTFTVAALALFLAGAGLAGVFPIMIGKIGTLYRNMTGTAIGIALFIALSGNSILNLMMGYFHVGNFPVFLFACVALQAIIIFAGRKYLVQK